jgi:hypothetical protein
MQTDSCRLGFKLKGIHIWNEDTSYVSLLSYSCAASPLLWKYRVTLYVDNVLGSGRDFKNLTDEHLTTVI